MKKGWKWVIGIVVALVIIAALVGGVILLRNHFLNNAYIITSQQPAWKVPGYADRQGDGMGRYPGMMPHGRNDWGWPGMGMRGPGMMRYSWLGILGGFVRGVFSLGFLALAVLGVIWLVNRLRKPAANVAAAVPVSSVASSVEPASDAPAAVSIAASQTCPKCGHATEADWKRCPYCGKKL
jgi:hypothetical protein